MKKSTAIAVCMFITAGLSWIAHAGDIEPPGPPAPTMVTLQNIYDRVATHPASVAKTGQTECWDNAPYPNQIDCAGTGQDGDYQTGVSVSPRFSDNGDGTVTDKLTGLIWLQDANCFPERQWTDALTDARMLEEGSCGLTDGSKAGDWRLPNVRELHSLIDFGRYAPALPLGHPFSVASEPYWSSTTSADESDERWYVGFLLGSIFEVGYPDPDLKVWPVRGGQ